MKLADLDEVMRTTFACREFTADPISDALVAEVLDAARFASSGANRQAWRVVAVRSAATRSALLELGRPAARRYVAEESLGGVGYSTINPVKASADDLAAVADDSLQWYRGLIAAPVLLVVGVELTLVSSIDADHDRVGVVSGASVYPFVQNILLAAHARGLGSVLTTLVADAEADVRQLIGLPEHVAVAALLPLGRPARVLTRLSRQPTSAFAHWDHWTGPPVTGSPE